MLITRPVAAHPLVEDFPGEVPGSGEVGGNHRIPTAWSDGLGGSHELAAAVVDENIQAAVSGESRLHGVAHGLTVSNVADDALHGAAQFLAQAGCGRVDVAGLAGGDDDGGALPAQFPGDGRSDSRAASRDQGHPTLQDVFSKQTGHAWCTAAW